MITAGDLRKGLTFEWDGDVWVVIDFQHVKPGKGAAFVRSKIKSVLTGGIKDTTFNPSEKFEKVVIEKDMVEDALNFMKENDMATINFYKGKPFRVTPQNFVELEVTETEPGVKGDTSSGGSKPATVETGYTLNVPLFINTGDVIRIDTRDGEYMSRV